MEPSLQAGWTVRIRPLGEAPRPGDVVLLSLPGGLTLHRLVHRSRRFLFHRGDAGGRVGVAGVDAGIGCAVAVLDPPDRAFPSADRLEPHRRRELRRIRLRCRLYGACEAALRRTGLGRWVPARLRAPLRSALLP